MELKEIHYKETSLKVWLKVNWVAMAMLFCISLFSFVLNSVNNDFPLHYHADELNKVKFVLENRSNYNHPLFMLEVNRTANWFAGYVDKQDAVELGRTISAFFGTLIVIFSYLFSAQTIGKNKALLVALGVAVSPLLVVHAHYLKEDIIFVSFCTASLAAFFIFINKAGRSTTILLGITMGLTFSSKYAGLILIPIFLLSPVICVLPERSNIYKRLGAALSVAAGLFLIVNMDIFFNINAFKNGLAFETRHVILGHHIRFSPVDTLFTFHLFNSIVPGITWILVIPALCNGFIVILNWRTTRWEERVLLLFTVMYYLTIEITPMKAFPDFMRYAAPLVPVMVYFAFQAIAMMCRYLFTHRSEMLCGLIFTCCLVCPAYDSIQLVYHLTRDTRAQLENFLKKNQTKIFAEHYTMKNNDIFMLVNARGSMNRLIPQDTHYLIAGSFIYDRYLMGAEYDQSTKVQERANFYQTLFEYPYIEFRPAYKSYGFSNPTIRLVDASAIFPDGRTINAKLDLGLKIK